MSGRHEHPIEALVFDFDGLILDTEMPVFVAWQEQFAAHGCPPLTVEEWAAEIGTVGGLDMVTLLQERATRNVDIDAMHAVRRARVHELVAAEVALPGIDEWLADAGALGLPLAIASTSAPEWVEGHLDRLGFRDHFIHVACYRDGLRPKPAPDIYLEACAALGVAPEHALAIEDSPNGVAAAKAAGLLCVAVPHAITTRLDLSRADLVITSLAATPLRDVLVRFATRDSDALP
jgi:HAD superfamily hydrolase (TIGR01509 family)